MSNAHIGRFLTNTCRIWQHTCLHCVSHNPGLVMVMAREWMLGIADRHHGPVCKEVAS